MEAIKSTIAENFGGISHSLAPSSQQFSLEHDVPDLTGKVAVVTGGSEGIGYGCVHTFLTHSISKIFILSLSSSVMESARSSISTRILPDAAQKITWFQCDISDWQSVAQISKKILEQTDRIDILVNDAARGIMTFQLTDYGVDRHMAVNHFGHVILTSHLLPLMKKTSKVHNTKVRIVNLGSNAHQATPSSCKFANLEELNQDLGPNGQYGRSKLATMLYSRWLGRKLRENGHEDVLVNATHPGFVDTKMSREDIHEPYPVVGYAMSVGMAPFKKDQWMGCVSTVFASTKTEKTGEYICPPAIPESGNALAQDEKLGEALMTLTRQIVKDKTMNDSVEKGCPFEFY